jgi:hypothetical protein
MNYREIAKCEICENRNGALAMSEHRQQMGVQREGN